LHQLTTGSADGSIGCGHFGFFLAVLAAADLNPSQQSFTVIIVSLKQPWTRVMVICAFFLLWCIGFRI
jgi:hypothetical protein